MAVYEGMRLATMLVCLGAANSLASPSRLIKVVPAALYEVGVAVVVAMTFTPQLVAEVQRVRGPGGCVAVRTVACAACVGVAMPVLEESLARSLALAAAMDSRGYGRTHLPGRQRLVTAVLTVGGMLGVCLGLYGSLDASSPRLLGMPLLALGVVAAALGLTLAGRRSPRSRYRPDPGGAGMARYRLRCRRRRGHGPGHGARGRRIAPEHAAAQVPTLPLLPVAGILIALLPAWVAPSLPSPVRRRHGVAGRAYADRQAEAAR